MKKRSKILLIAVCAMLLVAASVLGTIAYLTDTESVTNTMSVGQVGISLDESDVDNSTEGKDRDTENKYHLIPGQEYVKDPIVHVDAESENCYVYVKIVNNIAAIEDQGNTIAAQIGKNGWLPLEGVTGVYYQNYTKDQADKDLEVFGTFKIAGETDNTTLAGYKDQTIVVTAYAMQATGFNTAKEAWTAANFS